MRTERVQEREQPPNLRLNRHSSLAIMLQVQYLSIGHGHNVGQFQQSQCLLWFHDKMDLQSEVMMVL